VNAETEVNCDDAGMSSAYLAPGTARRQRLPVDGVRLEAWGLGLEAGLVGKPGSSVSVRATTPLVLDRRH
jgi:hypothetical protein